MTRERENRRRPRDTEANNANMVPVKRARAGAGDSTTYSPASDRASSKQKGSTPKAAPAPAAPAPAGKAAVKYTSADARLASIFERLADVVADTRRSATIELVGIVKDAVEGGSADDKEADDKEGQDKGAAGSADKARLLSRAFRRLVRGMCSSRNGARLGFSVAFAEVLRVLYPPSSASGTAEEGSAEEDEDDVPSLPRLLDYVLRQTESPDGKPSGQERRDYLFGRLYACTAIVRSEVLETDESGQWCRLLEVVCGLAFEVPWLREECGSTLCASAKKFLDRAAPLAPADPEAGSEKKSKKDKKDKKEKKAKKEESDEGVVSGPAKLAQDILDAFHATKLLRTPEGTALWLICAASPAAPALKFPENVWERNDPLCDQEASRLAAILREDYSKDRDAGNNEDGKGKGKGKDRKTIKPGIWKSHPNFSWRVVVDAKLAQLVGEANATEEEKVAKFAKFWSSVVDNNLFAYTASDERKSWGLQILTATIENAPAQFLPALIGTNSVKCILHQRGNKKNFLFAASANPLKALSTVLRKEEARSAVVPTLTALMLTADVANFDQLVKLPVVESSLDASGPEQVKAVVDRLIEAAEPPAKKKNVDEGATKRRLTAVENIVSLVKMHARAGPEKFDLADENSWCVAVLRGLARLAFFKDKKAEEDQPFRDTVKTRLNTILTSIVSLRQSSLWPAPFLVVSYIREKGASKKSGLDFDAEEEIVAVLETTHKRLDKINARAAKEGDSAKGPFWKAMGFLFAFAVLQIYSGDEDAVPLAEDLLAWYEATGKKAEDFGPLVEILLSLVAKQSVLMRKLAEQIFAVFTPYMDIEALSPLLTVLEQSEDKEGLKSLFDEHEEGEGEDEDEEDGEDDSDVQMLDAGASDSDAGSDDDENEEDEDDDAGDELDKFNELLASTLKTKNPHAKTDEDEDEEEDHGSDMDDEQMLSIDAHLSQVFKKQAGLTKSGARPDPKKDARQARDTMVNFKNRALDLLAIFLKQESGQVGCWRVVALIVTFIKGTAQQQLADRAKDILAAYYDHARSALPATAKAAAADSAKAGRKLVKEAEQSFRAVRLALEDAQQSRQLTKTFVRAASSACLFLARCIVTVDFAELSKVLQAYQDIRTACLLAALPGRGPAGPDGPDEATRAEEKGSRKKNNKGKPGKTEAELEAARAKMASANHHLLRPFFADFDAWTVDICQEQWRKQ